METRLYTQLANIGNMNTIPAMIAGATVLRNAVYRNWQEIDPDSPEWQVAVRVEGKEVEVIAIPEEGGVPFVEYGTVKMAAQPFFRPAIDETQDQVVAAVKEAVENQLRETIRSS